MHGHSITTLPNYTTELYVYFIMIILLIQL